MKKIIYGVLFFTIIGLLSVSFACSNENKQDTLLTYSGPEVVYWITGTANAVDVTLSNATGGLEQFSNIPLSHNSNSPGYSYSYDSFPSHSLYISAQNQGEMGTVTVEIFVNGQLYKTSTRS